MMVVISLQQQLVSFLILFNTLNPFVFADVEFTQPKAGATLEGGSTITIKWEDSGDKPRIKDLTTYEIFLCAGGNEVADYVQLTALASQGSFTAGNSATGTVPIGIGASKPENAYFLKMISVGKTGGTIQNFSGRFSLDGMNGAFPLNILNGLKKVSGTKGPSTVDQIIDAEGGEVAGDFGEPYNKQGGLTKYAPMQPVPETKMKKGDHTPLNPTSSVPIATTFLPPAKIETTITKEQTFDKRTETNTVAPAADPDDDMQKFLNRWKD